MLTDIGYRMNEYETVQLNRHDNRSLFSRPPRQKFTALEVSLSYLPAPPHIPTPTNIMIGLFFLIFKKNVFFELLNWYFEIKSG